MIMMLGHVLLRAAVPGKVIHINVAGCELLCTVEPIKYKVVILVALVLKVKVFKNKCLIFSVCKDPPYKVEESGYAGFILPIEVYFKNKVHLIIFLSKLFHILPLSYPSVCFSIIRINVPRV